MKNIIKQELLGKLLMEGRLENTIKKYAKDGEDVEEIKYLSDNDPSGNNKYLEWMVKNWLTPIGNVKLAYTVAPNRESLTSTVKNFHRLIQRLENKDINSYKTYLDLKNAVTEAEKKEKEAKKEKEKVKKAKKQAEVIYKDDDWLVISPKSWESSCYYGAGTKWCVSSKNNREHWDQYSRRSTFFYVIDRNKKMNDPLYKVAYRILSSGKEEVWDAEDNEISKYESGLEWLESLPLELVEKSKKHAWSIFPERVYANSWIDDDQYAQALVDVIGTDNIFHTEDMYYGCLIYRNEDDGKYYAVGDEEMITDSLKTYYESMSDSELIDHFDDYEIEDMIEMHDLEAYAEDYARVLSNNMSDDELLTKTNKTFSVQEMESKIDSLQDEIDDIDYQIADLNDEDEGAAEEEESLRDERWDLEDQIETERSSIDQYLEEVRDDFINDTTMDIESDIQHGGVVNFFVHEKGMYNNIKDLVNTSELVYLDREGLISSATVFIQGDDAYNYLFQNDDVMRGHSDDGEEFYVGRIEH